MACCSAARAKAKRRATRMAKAGKTPKPAKGHKVTPTKVKPRKVAAKKVAPCKLCGKKG
jgi:hypothetical protein